MMRTLILNGSPRAKGNTRELIKAFTQHLKGEHSVINTYDIVVQPCLDCRFCWENPSCALSDDMDKLYELIAEVDNFVLASSLNFSQLTGSLLSIASRFQYYYVSKCIRKDPTFYLKPKNGGLLLTAGGDTKNVIHALSTAKSVLRETNTKFIDSACSLNTDQLPVHLDREALAQAQRFAEQLNKLYDA